MRYPSAVFLLTSPSQAGGYALTVHGDANIFREPALRMDGGTVREPTDSAKAT